jgi:hypothetical protein
VSRSIRLHYERVVVTAIALAVLFPLFFMLTGFSVAGRNAQPLGCGTTIVELARDRTTVSDPAAACHAGAVERLHVGAGYAGAFLAVAFAVWLIAGARERWLNGAWEAGRNPGRRVTTPGDVWVLAALLLLVFVGVAQVTV